MSGSNSLREPKNKLFVALASKEPNIVVASVGKTEEIVRSKAKERCPSCSIFILELPFDEEELRISMKLWFASQAIPEIEHDNLFSKIFQMLKF